MILIFLFSSILNAQECPKYFGKQLPSGEWHFSFEQEDGYLPVESDSACMPQAGAYDLVNDRYVLNSAKLAAKKAAEEKSKDDGSLVDKKTIKALETRILELEKKLEAAK